MTGYRRLFVGAIAAIAALGVAGCAPQDADDDGLTIVASTDVYADIASAIAGDRAQVSAIISGPAIDPHSYEATARDQLALSRADIVIENGGGFDPFIDTLLGSLDGVVPVVITATELAGAHDEHDAEGHVDEHDHAENEGHDDHGHEDHDHDHDHEHRDGNEHVWYSLDTVGSLAAELAEQLTELDPAGSDDFASNLVEFEADLAGLGDRAAQLRAQHGGENVAVTEPAPLPLFVELELVNRTPVEFSAAIEGGTDVAPSVLLEMQRLIEGGSLALLAYNSQTSGPETDHLVDLAERSGVPVVTIGETLPQGLGYLDWMSSILDAVEHALS